VFKSYGEHIIPCGDDCTVRLWDIPVAGIGKSRDGSENVQKPLATCVKKKYFMAIDYQQDSNAFVTAGARVDIWEHDRSKPTNNFVSGSDDVISI